RGIIRQCDGPPGSSCGIGISAVPSLPKAVKRVRLPYPALPTLQSPKPTDHVRGLCCFPVPEGTRFAQRLCINPGCAVVKSSTNHHPTRPTLNRRYMATHSGLDFYAVNAYAVRTLAQPDEEFTNFA